MTKNLFALSLITLAGLGFAAEEAKPAAAAHAVSIEAHDSDKDGALSAAEIADIKDEKVKAAVVALDADKSGDVSAVEAKPAAKAEVKH